MIEPIEFWVAGVPKGQPRPKAFSRGGMARVYDPGTAEGWKGQIAQAAKPYLPATPLEMPLKVDITFYFPRPKGHYKGKKLVLRDDAPTFHTGKPDRDNLDKACLDALTVLRMWRDDSQVCDGRIRKFYDIGNGPGCWIRISEAFTA
jgi:Holliday junction resolvase RusA-like endonuclease